MMDTMYTDKIAHENFLVNLMVEQQQMEDYVNECVIFSSGYSPRKIVSELAVINEAKLSDRMKGLWVRLKSFFSKIYQKFLEKLNAWANDNHIKKYLEDYKDIIIGKKVTLQSVRMQDHFSGVNKINDVIRKCKEISVAPTEQELTNFTSEGKNNVNSSEDKKSNDINEYTISEQETVATKLGIKEVVDKSDSSAFSASCTALFNGGAEVEEFTGEQIGSNIKDIFNFLYSYENSFNGLNAFKNAYETGMDNFEKAYTKAVDNMKKVRQTGDNEAEHTSNPNSSNTAVGKELEKVTKEVGDAKKESVTYSSIYNRIITEADINSGAPNDASRPGTNVANTDGPVSTQGAKDVANTTTKGYSAATKDVKQGLTKDANTSAKISGAKTGVADVSVEKIGALQDYVVARIRAFSNIRTTVFGAILNAFTSTRNDYMDIVRAHVQSYLGTVDKSTQDTGQTGTGNAGAAGTPQ